MQSLDDIALLRNYAASGSEPAFEELVNRRIGFVYSAALRQVRDPQLAQEVTQAVFILLARKAGRVPEATALSGWLFNTTRFTALAHLRAVANRHRREQEAQMEKEIRDAPADYLWTEMSPLLDEALSKLGETERRAVLLRFFENKPLREVGDCLGVGEDAARKRVSRALEKLHAFFGRRGISSTTSLLAAAISTHSVHAAPATLAKSIAAVAVAKTGIAGGSGLISLKGALKLMAWSKTQTATVGLVLVGAATISVVQHQVQARLRAENLALQQQVANMQRDNEQISNLLSQTSNPTVRPADPSAELLRLRGEVGVLRQQSNELHRLLAAAQTSSGRSTSVREQAGQPEEYPKTAEAATKSIFETLGRGDLEGFFTNFAEPGVPKDMYDKMFNNEQVKNYLSGLEVLSVGQPTNSFGPNMWFVPYKIRLQDGTEKEMRLHIAQDPRTQKWYFKGGI